MRPYLAIALSVAIGLPLYHVADAIAQKDAPTVQAVVIAIKGKATITREGAKVAADAKKGDFLYAGDLLKTAPKSQAEIALTGGVIVRINQNSEFKTTGSKGGKEQNAGMKVGQIWTRVLHGKSNLRVTTPTAVAAVRGTEADISQRDTLVVKVYEGIVDVENSFGRTTLKQGEKTEVDSASSAPEPAQNMDAGDTETWQEDLKTEDSEVEAAQEQLEQQASGANEKTLKLKIDKDGEQKDLKIKFKKGE